MCKEDRFCRCDIEDEQLRISLSQAMILLQNNGYDVFEKGTVKIEDGEYIMSTILKDDRPNYFARINTTSVTRLTKILEETENAPYFLAESVAEFIMESAKHIVKDKQYITKDYFIDNVLETIHVLKDVLYGDFSSIKKIIESYGIELATRMALRNIKGIKDFRNINDEEDFWYHFWNEIIDSMAYEGTNWLWKEIKIDFCNNEWTVDSEIIKCHRETFHPSWCEAKRSDGSLFRWLYNV